MIIASLVTGGVGGAFQLPRLLSIILIPRTILIYKSNSSMKCIWYWCFVFLFFSAFSILWTPAGVNEGIIGLMYNIVHIFIFLEIIVFSRKAKNPMLAIILGYLVAFSISAVIAFWELTTDNHLSLSNMDEANTVNNFGETYTRYFASVTFYNLNGYVTFLCFLLPFLFYGFSSKYFKYQKLIFGISIVTALMLILFNGSRGGLLTACIMFVIYITKSRKDKYTIFYTFSIIALILFILLKYGEIILTTLSMRLMSQSLTEDEGRFTIWSNVMKVVFDYSFIGCGTEGLTYAMQHYANGGIRISHNLFLEILSQYGIIFLVVYVIFLLKIFINTRKIKDNSRRICIYQLIITFPIISIINSGYLAMPSLYVGMACLYIFANYESIKSFQRI